MSGTEEFMQQHADPTPRVHRHGQQPTKIVVHAINAADIDRYIAAVHDTKASSPTN